jgi:hypothetical protein
MTETLTYQYLTPHNLLGSVKRFRKAYKVIGDCWVWQRSVNKNGYAKFSVAKGQGLAKFVQGHRYSYELFHGPIPPGLVIDHLCRNHSCVRPQHLEAVTTAVNLERGIQANRAKTHCPKGHEYTRANTYHRKPGKAGRTGRNCRACAAINQERVRHANAA